MKDNTFSSGIVTPIMEPTKLLVDRVTSPEIEGKQFEIDNPYDVQII